MVAFGALVGITVQSQVAAALGLPVMRLLILSLIACLIGVVGAKVYYLATHRTEKPGLLMVGMSLQGFVLGAISTVALGSVALNLPLGVVLDASAPGLLIGAAIGRIGCFFGGCCAGRATASRWGLWSSNRRVGIRRIPVQLMDSAAAGALGATAVVVALRVSPSVPGATFVATVAAYIWVRQLLFALRDEPRKTAHGRVVMLLATSLAVLADLGLIAGLNLR
jgi:phosphatidylglycerol:prolipoprotein diacylglycerol transferase